MIQDEIDFSEFLVGDLVERVNSDYTMIAHVQSVFRKKSGALRYVVEDDRGTLFIVSAKNIKRRRE